MLKSKARVKKSERGNKIFLGKNRNEIEIEFKMEPIENEPRDEKKWKWRIPFASKPALIYFRGNRNPIIPGMRCI